jgi:hypothetical protein
MVQKTNGEIYANKLWSRIEKTRNKAFLQHPSESEVLVVLTICIH